jgi:hypothetical protein
MSQNWKMQRFINIVDNDGLIKWRAVKISNKLLLDVLTDLLSSSYETFSGLPRVKLPELNA